MSAIIVLVAVMLAPVAAAQRLWPGLFFFGLLMVAQTAGSSVLLQAKPLAGARGPPTGPGGGGARADAPARPRARADPDRAVRPVVRRLLPVWLYGI